jgi:chaperone required for assembly of F1-ATPase
MKRFYEEADVANVEQGFEVQLDGRPVKTPARNALTLPTQAMAAASAAEWNDQGDELDMAAMPMTALAYAAVDRIGPALKTFSLEVARFAETDLLCYRAPDPPALRARQDADWDPILSWLEQRHGAKLVLAEGIMPINQPEAALVAVRAAFAELDAFQLTTAHSAARIVGSAGITLAFMAGEIDANRAADIADIDDLYQLEHWGEDEQARALLTRRRVDLVEIGRFLELIG